VSRCEVNQYCERWLQRESDGTHVVHAMTLPSAMNATTNSASNPFPLENTMHLNERTDCTMCQFWSMLQCQKQLDYFPNEGHRCPAFTYDPEMDDTLDDD